MGLLNFNGIVKYYGNRCLLNEVTFTVERGDRLALIGPNGSGKTTLLRIANGLESCDMGGASFSRGTRVGYLMQNFEMLGEDENALYWSEVVKLEQKMSRLQKAMADAAGNELSELMAQYERVCAKYESMDGYVVESRLKATLLGLGLKSEALTTPISKLSSGERMRVALARILLTSPDLLILDEPTNHLDVNATMWLEEYLKGFSGGVLVVSHDRYFLDRVATRIVELNNGSVVSFKGNYSSFLQQKQIRLDFLNKERARLDREILREKEIYTTLRSHRMIKAAQSREKVIARLTEERAELRQKKRQGHLGAVNTASINLKPTDHISAEIAVCENASKRFGDVELFSAASFVIGGGEHLAIVGPNGCGKTTLLRMLQGLDADFTGKCRIGSWVRTGVLDQNTEFDDTSLSMIQLVTLEKEQTEDSARLALSRVGFYGDEIFKPIGLLSGGERVRLKLALLMQQNPQCLILDEPTNHLDLPAREAVENAVASFRGTVIAVSHDRYFLNRCAERILAFENKRLVSYEGNWDDYMKATALDNDKPAPAGKKRGAAKPAAPAASAPDPSVELEKRIEALEAKKDQLEAALNELTPLDTYLELQSLYDEIDALYAEWLKIGKP
ncbi:MAG: ABC-F family ATP-binding cassette domain-containing protein [Clostridia bacterium]|nr:ABC-F family ATP-binding cassette domain-containing protein [Clostridia bacterium]